MTCGDVQYLFSHVIFTLNSLRFSSVYSNYFNIDMSSVMINFSAFVALNCSCIVSYTMVRNCLVFM